MRKKDIINIFSEKFGMTFSHSIKTNTEKSEYSVLIKCLSGCKDMFVESAFGQQIQWAGPDFKILLYLPIRENWCLSAYYSPDNEMLFWYFDISRKNFIDEYGMLCMDDIFLDLVILPDGQTLTLDTDELQEALDKGEISKEDFDNAYAVHDQIINSEWSNVDFLNEVCKKLLLEHELGDIPDFENFVKIEPINEGLSKDKKFYVESADGKRLLLRVSDISEHDRQKAVYNRMKQMASHEIPMPIPVDFGLCNDGKSVYQFWTWCNGDSFEVWNLLIERVAEVATWCDNMNNPVPTWYLKDFYIQWTDGVPYKLKEPFDFSFLDKYGKVFKVFDDQDSGNICFGMKDGEEKRFVKFAGAPTERSNVTQSESIERMKSTIQIYKDLSHPVLANLLYADEIGGGIVCVFDWLDAECMGRQYPQSRERFLQISPEAKLQIFGDILSFHLHVAKQNYVAIDFYDGCIMYDFDKCMTAICDIELYEKAPATNNMGRMYGSSRFMSPEEFQLGATIDEITNVYTMGATAFALFSDERDRSYEKWTLSKGLFDVAKKAVSDERSDRQQSIKQFITEWKAAKGADFTK